MDLSDHSPPLENHVHFREACEYLPPPDKPYKLYVLLLFKEQLIMYRHVP